MIRADRQFIHYKESPWGKPHQRDNKLAIRPQDSVDLLLLGLDRQVQTSTGI